MYKILKNIIEMDDYSVQKLSKSQPPEPFEWNTVEGTELNVSDCIGGKGKIEVKGNTEQEQLSGKNLFNHYLYPRSVTQNGVTVTNNGDGSFTLNGTCTENNTIFNLGQTEDIKKYVNEGAVTHTAYYISGSCTKGQSSSARTIIRLNYDTGTDKMIPLQDLSTQKVISKINPQDSRNDGWSWAFVLASGDSFNNFTIKYQVEKGTVGTDWEQYCGGQAAPNPSYEIPIKVVTGNNLIKHVGKNLFVGYDNMLNGFLPTANSYPTVNSSYPNARYQILELKAGESITTTIDANYSEGRIRAIDAKTNQVISSIELVENDYYSTTETYAGSFRAGTITAKKDLLIGVMLLKRPTIDLLFQIEYGNTPTPYEPYREKEYKLDLWKENEFDSENASVIEALLKGSNATLISNSHEQTIIIQCKKI